MGPEHLLLLHNLGHVELLVELEGRARAIRATREARAERIRALRRAADGAGATVRQAAGALTGRPLAVDRSSATASATTCATACATA